MPILSQNEYETIELTKRSNDPSHGRTTVSRGIQDRVPARPNYGARRKGRAQPSNIAAEPSIAPFAAGTRSYHGASAGGRDSAHPVNLDTMTDCSSPYSDHDLGVTHPSTDTPHPEFALGTEPGYEPRDPSLNTVDTSAADPWTPGPGWRYGREKDGEGQDENAPLLVSSGASKPQIEASPGRSLRSILRSASRAIGAAHSTSSFPASSSGTSVASTSSPSPALTWSARDIASIRAENKRKCEKERRANMTVLTVLLGVGLLSVGVVTAQQYGLTEGGHWAERTGYGTGGNGTDIEPGSALRTGYGTGAGPSVQ